MTYVREQSSTELAVHMRSLQKMPGWHDPLADRLWQEVEALKAEVAGLRTGYEAYERVNAELKGEVEGLRKALTSSREFLMRDAKVRRMTDGARHISPMFPLRKLVMEQIDAALGQGEQS
ncbi:hypothetical protein [Pseudomonas extremaustralis]|uniref:Uncharacterized protein n=1 Tax=Pseudomonas extremaustralis TaxID=359110 RepID=A0A5C5PYF0_9PSED|nr:hypothetical protein [Pseudomonas extremaustralis]EZI22894.1 hypothetical protein PE143B_0130955 [Pseudomonas extremaustralis 14-3 substr. 14-3b]TWR95290.1 hypothetical protein FIV36_31075 [Pseudomonas extremaustralis]SDE69902.1 hypothetical protein SAMN05216591_0659 [Pseudomonas extremaustralis]SDG45517.1 hypothetical protein SAMN05216591_6135 [Pseudomonas extremaustralis]